MKDFKQQFGVNYTKTFALTACAAILQILLSIAASCGTIIKQADVKNIYLNSPSRKTKLFICNPLHITAVSMICI